jgi:hypothetical protein
VVEIPRRLRKRTREERLEQIRQQVEAGSLVIRQATPEERERYGIRADHREDEARAAEQ